MDRKFKGAGLIVLAVLPLLIAASGGFPSRPRFQLVTVAGLGSEKLRLNAADSVGDDYIGYYESNGTTRKAYLGFGNAADDTFIIQNEESGATLDLRTTGGAAVQVNTITIPTICAFDADVDATPSIVASFNCSPSIARNSAGNFTVTHNFANANQYQIVCNQRTASGTTPGFVSIQSESSNSAILRTYDAAGAASDGLQNIACLIVRFLFT